MKNFEKFRSRALNSDALKEIKGGSATLSCHEVTPECTQIYRMCSATCGDLTNWFDCVISYGAPCSPLVGFDNVCNGYCP